jgi:tagatose-1,6-bisphosphate aldolase non-catalytic subunit AgaZ/GatZ
MNTKIFKYKIHHRRATLQLPSGAKPLTVAMQGGDLYLWAEVDPNQPTTDRRFYVIGTGAPLPDGYRHYVGTAHDTAAAHVWHVYEVHPRLTPALPEGTQAAPIAHGAPNQ